MVTVSAFGVFKTIKNLQGDLMLELHDLGVDEEMEDWLQVVETAA